MRSAELSADEREQMKQEANRAFVQKQNAQLAQGNGTAYEDDKVKEVKKKLEDLKYENTTEDPKDYKDMVEKSNNISKRIIPGYLPENYTLDKKDTFEFANSL